MQQKKSQREIQTEGPEWRLPTVSHTALVLIGICKPSGQFTAPPGFCPQKSIAFRTEGF